MKKPSPEMNKSSPPDSPFFTGTFYAFLSSIYRDESNADSIRRFFLSWKEFSSNSNRINSLNFRFDEKSMNKIMAAVASFQKTWADMDTLPNSELSLNLRKEYALMFLTPNGVKPYESFYLGTKKRLMDEPWVSVKDFYHAAGMEKGVEEEHPEDHIAVELGFMSYLAFLTPDPPETRKEKTLRLQSIKMQAEFLSNHILQWVPSLCQDMESVSGAPFYTAAARFTNSFIREDTVRILNIIKKNSK